MSVAGRILTAVGLSFISVTGLNTLQSYFINEISRSIGGFPDEATGKYYEAVGEAAANSLLSVLIQNDRFKSATQFVAYIGLDPKENQSGTSLKGRPRISKLGNTHLRTTLFIPAMHAYRSRTFAKYVSRLQKNGKRPKVIIVALMRKLAVIAYYLIKAGQDFDNSRYE